MTQIAKTWSDSELPRNKLISEAGLQAARIKWVQGRGGANSVGLTAKSIGLRTLPRASVRHALVAAEGFGSFHGAIGPSVSGKGGAHRARKDAVAES